MLARHGGGLLQRGSLSLQHEGTIKSFTVPMPTQLGRACSGCLLHSTLLKLAKLTQSACARVAWSPVHLPQRVYLQQGHMRDGHPIDEQHRCSMIRLTPVPQRSQCAGAVPLQTPAKVALRLVLVCQPISRKSLSSSQVQRLGHLATAPQRLQSIAVQQSVHTLVLREAIQRPCLRGSCHALACRCQLCVTYLSMHTLSLLQVRACASVVCLVLAPLHDPEAHDPAGPGLVCGTFGFFCTA